MSNNRSKEPSENLVFSLSLMGILTATCILTIIELVAFRLEERAAIIVYGGSAQFAVVFFSTFALTSFVFFCGQGKEYKSKSIALQSGLGVAFFILYLQQFLLVYLPLWDLSQTKDLLIFLLYTGTLVSLIFLLPTSVPIFFPKVLKNFENNLEKEGETEKTEE